LHHGLLEVGGLFYLSDGPCNRNNFAGLSFPDHRRDTIADHNWAEFLKACNAAFACCSLGIRLQNCELLSDWMGASLQG